MTIDDGGTAFSTTPPQRDSMNGEWQQGMSGMTLMDWFAGQALAGLMANPSVTRVNDGNCVDYSRRLMDGLQNEEEECSAELMASQDAYAFAVAMVAEKRRLEAQK